MSVYQTVPGNNFSLSGGGSADVITGNGTGTVTNVSSANSAITVTSATTTPSITFNAGNVLTTALNNDAGFVRSNVQSLMDYGFVGKGLGTVLSSRYATLAAAQAVYPHAVALTDTFDWAAIQALYNAQVTASYAAAIILPAGDAVLSRPVKTGAVNTSVTGQGQDVTRLVMLSGGTGAWVHGDSTTPAVGSFELKYLTVIDGNSSGSGSTGISLRFSSSAPAFACSFNTVAIRKWTNPVSITNLPRGWDCSNVTIFGPDFAMQAGAGITVTSTSDFTAGCFSYVFNNVMVANYTWGWKFNIGVATEGMIFTNCKAYNGWGLVQVNNSVSSYQSLLWEFNSCDWQGLGFALDMNHCRKISVRGGYWICNTNSGALANPGSETRRRYFAFKDCADIRTYDIELDVAPSQETSLSLVYCDSTCLNARFYNTIIKNFSTIYAAFEFANTTTTNTLVEKGTAYAQWTGGTKIVDSGHNQITETLVSNATGSVTEYGAWHLFGLTSSITTDGSGLSTISLPTRDGTNPYFLGGPPIITVSAKHASVYVNTPTVQSVTTTAFVIKADANFTLVVAWQAWGV